MTKQAPTKLFPRSTILSFSLYFAFCGIGTVSGYMACFAAAETESVISFPFPFSFRLRWLRALSCEVAKVSAVEATFAFAFDEVELATLFDELPIYGPSFFVYRPAAVIQRSQRLRLLVRGVFALVGCIREDATADAGYGTDVHRHCTTAFPTVGGRRDEVRV